MDCNKGYLFPNLSATLKKAGFFSITLVALMTLFSRNTTAQEIESGISELWQELYVYHRLNGKWSGEVLFNNLYSSELGNYDWFLEGKVTFHAKKWLDVEAMYRHEFYDFNGSKVHEYRPMMRLSGKTTIGNWCFRNRHRLELRMFEIADTRFRYRTDLKVKPNWKWTSLKINPYFQEEIFIDRRKLSRNRIYGGVEAKWGRVEPAIYMLVQSDYLGNSWINRLVGGVVLGIEL
ncbi:DUF2490 domain-containing protein [Sunxiuqinia sp. sy24]|uniref:DUF2490 domain-containing protein n=1 Tax=Sunxiuqinia sp. sy24 TaxID=3461495 RepID=UPI004046351C